MKVFTRPSQSSSVRNAIRNTLQKRILMTTARKNHMDSQQFQCTKCRAFFKCNRDLQEHIRDFHMQVKVDCWTCGRIFNSKHTLKTHIQNEHRNANKHVSGYPEDFQLGWQEGRNRQHEDWQTVGGRKHSHNEGYWTGHQYERDNFQTPIFNKFGPLQTPGNGGWE